ncbi:MAG: hypothetical protein ACFCD0_12225 [Gemmataceae bacterium]
METEYIDEPLMDGEDSNMFQQFLAQGGSPAFVSRGAQVEESFQRLLRKCQKQRREWLEMFCLRLATVKALAGSFDAFRLWLSEDQVNSLQELHDELRPRLRIPRDQTDSPKVIEKALKELQEAIHFFNNRWKRFLHELDLSKVNDLREKYNAYYLIEKECVVRSPVVARRQFEELKPVTMVDLLSHFPLLPELDQI